MHDSDTPKPDVVVVGAGMGGLVAALAALEDGAKVLLVEKGPEPGGTFAYSGGGIWTHRTFEAQRQLVPEGDPALARVVVDDFEDAIDWLRGHGVQLAPRVEANYPHTSVVIRSYHLEPDPVSAGVMPVVAAIERAGGTILYRTAARALLMDKEAVCGVRLRGRHGLEDVQCGAVVLATGGFQGDVELTTRYISRWADRLFLRANPYSTGDGLRMALSAGAATSRGLHAFYGHLVPAPPASVDVGSAQGLSALYTTETVILNLKGERFVDESIGDDVSAQALAREPEARGFLVFDHTCYREHVLERIIFDLQSDPLANVPSAGGVVLRSDSLADMARQLAPWGLPVPTAQATLEQYDAAVVAGTLGDLWPSRRERRHRLCQPPFYGIPVRPGITFTHGGISVNTTCHALDRDGVPVEGLYAAGVDVGNFSHVGYAGGLGVGLVTGLRAGIHAARAARGEKEAWDS